jgi:CHAT domain-containing protein/tetratricopeptide (TPR) repeat protein
MFNQIHPVSTQLIMINLLIYIGLSATASQTAQESQSLESGKPVERKLAGGQSHVYQITITSGQYLQIVVDQRGIDVVVSLFAPDGERRSEADSPYGTAGTEIVSAIAEAAGVYRIEVRSPEKTAQTGRYEIKVEALREATGEDRYRVTAEAVFLEAKKLRFENGTLEAKRKSIEKHREALDLYRRVDDRRGEAETLNCLGQVQYSLGEMQKALDSYNESLKISRAAGDRSGEAVALSNIGAVYWSSGDMQKALEHYHGALPINRAVGNRGGEAEILTNMGMVYSSSGEMQKALDSYSEALPISRAAGDRSGEARTLNAVGVAYESLGEMQKALDSYNETLSIRKLVGDRAGEAVTLNNIGAVYQALGEMQKALGKYNESLAIKQTLGDRRGEVVTLGNIGTAYRLSGEMQKALDKFAEALAISRTIGYRTAEGANLANIGSVYLSSGELNKALDKFNEALPIRRSVGDRRGEAATLNNIGIVYDSLGERQKALEKFNEALPISRAVGNRVIETAILSAIARVEEKLGNLAQARQSAERAIGIVESLRTNIASQELRASFFASQRELYESYIDILMQMHQQNPTASLNATALAVCERARARSLLELLAESRADIRQGVDSSLIARERSLRQRLTAKATAQVNLLTRNHTPEQEDLAAREIASINAEYEELETRIRTSSPKYAALTRPQPLNLSEIQEQLLAPETLLLEYSLGDQASYLFLVSHDSISSYQLPKRAEIEGLARRVYELLTAPQPKQGETATERQARIGEARKNYWPQAAALSQLLLGPVASQLGAKRLLIVADGALQYVPFGALPVPVKEGERESGRARERRGEAINRLVYRSPTPPLSSPNPLIVEHEIVHLPSASTLAVLRRELAGRQPAPKAVAVLADPVFSTDDGRVRLPHSKDNALASNLAPSELTRALGDVRGELTRLLMTRDEAQAILSLARPGVRLEALDFRASRATSTSGDLSQYRIVHFATHGLLNSEHPQLSGLVLSLVDERGQPQDGFLQLHEIFNLRLPAELVVLSACQTGLGKEIKGEGLVGLTRGFMYAGAARVAASLWKVDDAATAELMKLFYRRMLREGMRPAAALRAAQVEMWKRPQWQSPFYWGAFVLQGEWK